MPPYHDPLFDPPEFQPPLFDPPEFQPPLFEPDPQLLLFEPEPQSQLSLLPLFELEPQSQSSDDVEPVVNKLTSEPKKPPEFLPGIAEMQQPTMIRIIPMMKKGSAFLIFIAYSFALMGRLLPLAQVWLPVAVLPYSSAPMPPPT